MFSNLVLIENKLRLDDICAVFLFFFSFTLTIVLNCMVRLKRAKIMGKARGS